MRLWLGLAITVLLLVLFLVTVDVGGMLRDLADANYVFVAPGIALYLVSVGFRTLRWHVLMRHMKHVSVARLYPVVVVGYMANNLLPMRLGELVRSFYVGEREGISKTSALATIFVERVLDALVLLFFVFAIALFVPLAGLAQSFGDRLGIAWPLLATASSAPFVAAFAALLLFAFFPARALGFATAVVRPLPERIASRIAGLIRLFLDGLTPLRSPRTLTILFLLSMPIWLFESALFFFVGFSFGLENVYESLSDLAVSVVLVTALANIGSSVPAAPGGIGLFELVARETLVLIPLGTVERSLAAGYAAVVHAALLLPMILLGQAFLWAEHVSLRSLSRAGQAGTAGPSGTEPTGSDPSAPAISVEADESQ